MKKRERTQIISEMKEETLQLMPTEIRKEYGSDGKASVYNVEDPGSIPGSGRSSREGNGNSLQYSCLGNPMDRGGTWQATVHRVAKESDTT